MWLLILFLIGGFFITSVVLNLIEERKQKIGDRVALDVLGGFNFQKEKQKILAIAGPSIPRNYECDLCGGMLVLRRGIYGRFLGCSNYPNCRFTKKVK